jgi:cation:H+ antiporter
VIYLVVFVASGAAVVVAATALARYADVIAESTGLGRLWIGMVLLAGATSLPELATDITAVRIGATDLAVGDLFGSSMANMLILSVIDLFPQRGRVLRQAALDHALAAGLAIALNSVAAVLVMIRPEITVLGVGPGSFLLFAAYLIGTRWVYRHATRHGPAKRADDAAAEPPRRPLRRAIVGFAIAALAVLATAPAFAWSAKGIAEISGLGHTFVGTWLVGLATSLPELVACIAAVRLGAFDLAVGNLFGSNALNMAIFIALDLAHPGSLFADVDPSHVVSALFSTILMSLGLVAIVYRAKRKKAAIEPDSLLMLAVYGVALWLVYVHAAGT